MSYKEIRELGRGGFGVVHLVEDSKGGQWARKTFAPPTVPGLDPADLRARFEREVRYQSAISHPNVVAIVDHDLKVDPPYFIMELAEGSLHDEIQHDRSLGGNPSKPLFDILAGLEAMHGKGYRHRDLNPRNVLKFSSPTSRYAISDFGLMAPAAGATSTLTSTHMQGGTPLYCAPECAVDFKRATAQSDIYSFGAILHDIFAGGAARVPYTELSCGGPVGPIIEICTKTNPHRRFKSVAHVREKLYEVLKGPVTITSQEDAHIVALLQGSDNLTEDQWDAVFNRLIDNERKNQSNSAIFRALKLDHIRQLATDAPQLLAALGADFSAFIQSSSFDFDYCDVLANKAMVFYQHGDLDLQARIAIAVLVLGVGHNRWAVERVFMEMAGADIADVLAERICVELATMKGVNFEVLVSHVERSIRVNRNALHPKLRALLK